MRQRKGKLSFTSVITFLLNTCALSSASNMCSFVCSAETAPNRLVFLFMGFLSLLYLLLPSVYS